MKALFAKPARTVSKHGGWFEYHSSFVTDHGPVMDKLLVELPLQQELLKLYGREVLTPRQLSWHGDGSYSYSGRRFSPMPWTPMLAHLRDKLNAYTGTAFNSVLANYYRDGNDSIGEHADNEKGLGPVDDDIRIASISLGTRRTFVLRSKDDTWRFDLGEGDLFLMGGTLQRQHTHYVPKQKTITTPRLNLTFRVVV